MRYLLRASSIHITCTCCGSFTTVSHGHLHNRFIVLKKRKSIIEFRTNGEWGRNVFVKPNHLLL